MLFGLRYFFPRKGSSLYASLSVRDVAGKPRRDREPEIIRLQRAAGNAVVIGRRIRYQDLRAPNLGISVKTAFSGPSRTDIPHHPADWTRRCALALKSLRTKPCVYRVL